MSETAKGEKPVASDKELRSELDHLESLLPTKEAHVKEMKDRIAALKTKLGVK